MDSGNASILGVGDKVVILSPLEEDKPRSRVLGVRALLRLLASAPLSFRKSSFFFVLAVVSVAPVVSGGAK